MSERLKQLETWLTSVLDAPIISLKSASEDASFRRYFRVVTAQNSYIVMDAPPLKESVSQFIYIDDVLRGAKVHAPEIIASNVEHGFLLLEDLGDRTYLYELSQSADKLYADAIDALIKIQNISLIDEKLNIPPYASSLLKQELDLFEHWYLKRHLNIVLDHEQTLIWADTQTFLIELCLSQPQVLVHRDYHSRNLMIVDENSPAVIDFQDMVVGPIAYDLASLFKDCYIEWPRAQQHAWLAKYLSLARAASPSLNIELHDLIRWVDLTGLQRHLKVLGIFCRLNYRDQKPQYLDDLGLVKKYVLETVDLYPELDRFATMCKQLLAVE